MGLSGVQISGTPVSVEATRVVIDSGTSAILLGASDSVAIHKVSLTASPAVLPPKMLPDLVWMHHVLLMRVFGNFSVNRSCA